MKFTHNTLDLLIREQSVNGLLNETGRVHH